MKNRQINSTFFRKIIHTKVHTIIYNIKLNKREIIIEKRRNFKREILKFKIKEILRGFKFKIFKTYLGGYDDM